MVAADGFNFMRSGVGIKLTSKCAQKIYELSGTDRQVACSLTGRVTIFNKADEQVFDFASACCDAARAVESVPARDANEFAAQILPIIQQRLAAIKESGKLDRYPSPMRRQVGERGRTMVRIHLDGYFNGLPFRTGIRFFHDNQELGWEPSLHELNPWRKSLFYGLLKVTDVLLKTDDPRLEKYRTPACKLVAARENNPEIAISLEDAVELRETLSRLVLIVSPQRLRERHFSELAGTSSSPPSRPKTVSVGYPAASLSRQATFFPKARRSDRSYHPG